MNADIRNGMIDQAQQQRMARDTVILQKVNAAYREAFTQKFPGQCDHILRLIAERLQSIMTNKPRELNNPETWPATAAEIRDLSEAMYYVYNVHKEIRNEFQSISAPPQGHE